MATWCPNCSQQIPQLHRLREHFSKGDLEMFGVPMDESETDEQLLRYFEKNRPPYMLDGRWNLQPRADFKRLILEHFQMDVLPATMITSQQGQVLAILPGVPTVSETARLLHTLLSQETGTSGD
jgi:peroxiredoxin